MHTPRETTLTILHEGKNLLMHAFMYIIIGLPLDDTIRTTHERMNMNIFGLMLAFYGVIEVQGRGDLHMHVLVLLIVCAKIIQQCA